MSAKGCFFVVPVNLLLIACVVMSCDFCVSSPITPRSTAAAAPNLESSKTIPHPRFNMKITAKVNGNQGALIIINDNYQRDDNGSSDFFEKIMIFSHPDGNEVEIMTMAGAGGHRANHSHFQVVNTETNTGSSGKNDSSVGLDAEPPPKNDTVLWALSSSLDKSSPNRLVRKFGYFVSLIGFVLSWIGYQLVSCSNSVAMFGNWIEEFGMVVTGLGN